MSGPSKLPTLPFEPLIPIIEARYRPPNPTEGKGYNPAISVVGKTAAVTGMTRERLSRAVRSGVNIWLADEIATSLGMHAREIWLDEWDATL